LAFIGLLVRVSPLPLVEAQVKAALRVFSNPSAFNYTEEAVDIMTRYTTLSSRFNTNDPNLIMKQWNKLIQAEAFDYRDMLCRFAEVEITFKKTRVPDWEPELYFQKDVLRRVWIRLEKEGKAEELVNGVGSGGLHEWVDLLRKLAKMAQEKDQGEGREDLPNRPKL
jgi:hypothetical protein